MTRRLVLLVALVALLAVLWLKRSTVPVLPIDSVGAWDFVQYWSASRLMWRGSSPYDLVALLAEEQAAGWPESYCLPMLNPPWTLALVAPAALLPFGLAARVWLVLQLVMMLGGGIVLWRYFAAGDRRYWIGLVLAAGFVPGLVALRLGQCTGLLLLGIVGFLWAEQNRKDLLAGAALALLMIKPHVTFLLWPAVLWWAFRNRRPGVLAGWIGALLAGSIVALVFTPQAFAGYLAMMAGPQQPFEPATLGAWLLRAFGRENNWVSFLPSLLGGLGLLFWLWRRRGPWKWPELAGPLLLASVITSAYGWVFDHTVLLPVLVDLVSRARSFPRARRRALLVALGVLELVVMGQNMCRVAQVYSVWQPLALAGLYWWGIRRERGHSRMARGEDNDPDSR